MPRFIQKPCVYELVLLAMKSFVMVLNDFTRKASLTTWYFTQKQLKIKQVLNALQKYTWDCWVYDQSPTLARNGEDHGYIRMDKYLH